MINVTEPFPKHITKIVWIGLIKTLKIIACTNCSKSQIRIRWPTPVFLHFLSNCSKKSWLFRRNFSWNAWICLTVSCFLLSSNITLWCTRSRRFWNLFTLFSWDQSRKESSQVSQTTSKRERKRERTAECGSCFNCVVRKTMSAQQDQVVLTMIKLIQR